MRIINRLTALLLSVSLVFTGIASASSNEMLINGSGWGHGIGFSQYGSRALADSGMDNREILRHYFSGVELRDVDTLDIGGELLNQEKNLWIGLAQNRPDLTFEIMKGNFELCSDESAKCLVTVQKGEKWKFGYEKSGLCVFSRLEKNGEYMPIFSPGSCSASVRSVSDSSILKIPRKGNSYKRGDLRFRESPSSGRLQISYKLGIEDFLKGIREMPDSWPGAALEAQAIVSRTIAVRSILDHGNGEEFSEARVNICSCHLFDSDPEIVYGGYTSETGHPFWQGRVGATKGQVITWGGEVIEAKFTSSTAGKTESNKDGAGYFAPYLVSVDDSFSILGPARNPFREWVKKVDPNFVASKFGFMWLSNAKVASRNESGSVRTVRMEGIISGFPSEVTVSGKKFENELGLLSPFFDISMSLKFSDVNGMHPFAGEIIGLSELGITSGCTATEFCPSHNVTREQMAAFLVRALDLEIEEKTDLFSDDDGSFFEAEIETLYRNGITSGCTATEFCPSDNVTREQMAAFLVRALKATKIL